MPEFSLPNDGEIYISNIIQRCYDLINAGIWSGITITEIDSWLSCFEDENETYFAACILDSLIYRSEAQTVAMSKQLFQRVLPDLIRKIKPSPIYFRNLLESLQSESDSYIRLVTVQPPRSTAEIKSSPTLLRMMRRNLKIKSEWIISSDEISNAINRGVKVFVFVDDFLGTGVQFDEFLDEIEISKYSKLACFIYAPLVSHETGLNALRGKYKELYFTQVELLTKKNEVFSSDAGNFNDGVNTPNGAKDFYYKLLKKNKINLMGGERRGFGALEVLYAFSHAAPDNSLPILWWDESDWKPLFSR